MRSIVRKRSKRSKRKTLKSRRRTLPPLPYIHLPKFDESVDLKGPLFNKNFDKSTVPVIKSIKWGSVVVGHGNKTQTFKDVIIEPAKIYSWDFKQGFDAKVDKVPTGHQHNTDFSKGIQPHSIRELINKGDVFILSTGFDDALGVNENTIKTLEKYNKKVIVLNSSDVMSEYNKLSKTSNVVALVHSTC